MWASLLLGHFRTSEAETDIAATLACVHGLIELDDALTIVTSARDIATARRRIRRAHAYQSHK